MQQENHHDDFLEPWRSTHKETENWLENFVNRLHAAIGPGHVLYGLPVRVIGHSSRLHNTLFEILDGSGRLAVVPLTREKAQDPPPKPDTTIYPNFEAFKTEKMVPQVCKYLATPDPEQLIAAAKIGDLDRIRRQVEMGVDIDAARFPGGTALCKAADENQIEAAKLLLELGADVEKADDSPMPMTALFRAVTNGHEEMARLLLEHNADPNAMFLNRLAKPRNCLEFLKSREWENTSLYRLLLDYGAVLPTYISMVEKYPEQAAYITEAVVSAEYFIDGIELTTYLIEKQPNSTLYYQRGVAYDMTRNLDAALADFNAAIALDPANFQALYSRSLVQRKLGRWRESSADLEAAAKVNPSDFLTLNALASTLLHSPDEAMRNPERAVHLANDACKLSDWQDALCITTLAEAYRTTGNESKATELDQKAAELRELQALL